MEHEKIKLFEQNKGKALSLALHVESELEFFISTYFVNPQCDKTHFLNDEITLKMGFEQKIELFKKICEREEFEKQEINKIIESIRFIQELRNKIAHWQSEINYDANTKEQNMQLRKRTSFTTSKDILKLDEKTMTKFEEEGKKAIEGIIKFNLKYLKEGTIDARLLDGTATGKVF